LLWAVDGALPTGSHDRLGLKDLIAKAATRNLITTETAQQAELAKDARNLVHPGNAMRSGANFSKATALTALTAVYRIAEDLGAVVRRGGAR
jgi:hypothetical protein